MQQLKAIGKGESLVDYSDNLMSTLFKGVFRDNGLAYDKGHLKIVAGDVKEITLPSIYQNAAVSASLLHDSAEDKSDLIDVYDPYVKTELRRNVTYLNDLLANSDEEGKHICYMVNLLTHREGTLYMEYVNNIFSFPGTEPERSLHTLTGVIKMCDRRRNTNPRDEKNLNDLVEKYLSLKKADKATLEKFYKRTKTIDAFRRRGSYDIDVALFVKTLLRSFESKQKGMAYDNLFFYLPMAEKKLLIDMPKDNSLFDWDKFRSLLKDTYHESFKMYGGDMYELKRIGMNRGRPNIPGYKYILREIREDKIRNKENIN